MPTLNSICRQVGLENTTTMLTQGAQSCPLDKALSYQNDNVVYRFIEHYDISFDEAKDVFFETKKWLWLCNQPRSFKLEISEPILIIDEMWHTFILLTYDYTNYCFDCFGQYIHHIPTPQHEKEKRQREYEKNPTCLVGEQTQALRQQYALIIDKLGQATLLKWFVEYPERYNEDFFIHRRKVRPFIWKPTPEFRALSSHLQAGRKVVMKKN
jgi:hypothetical protein